MAELFMYLFIYKLLIDHDRKMKVLLQTTAISRKVQKNVISLAGHAINFTVETVWFIGFLFMELHGTAKDEDQLFLFHLFEQNMYGVLSLLHIIFSQPLRSDCIEIKNTLLDLFYTIFPSEFCLKLIVQMSKIANIVTNASPQ